MGALPVTKGDYARYRVSFSRSGRWSATGLSLGPYMIEEIERALWLIYGVCLGDQYRIN
jgi:hypothetical protein